ncbi:MAG: ABC transporter permease, partial [Lentisphaerota bacterium]
MANDQIRILYRNQRHETGWLQTWLNMARNIWLARDMIWQLFKRDFTAAHRKSFIGSTWMIVHPLMEAAFWMVLQATHLLQPGATGIPYPVYAFAGVTLWSLFSGFYGAGINTLSAGGPMLIKVHYPHEATLAKQLLDLLASFSLRFLLLLLMLTAFGMMPSWKTIFFPLVALPVFFLGTGLGLLASLLHAISSDINRLLTFLLRLWMLATPLVYADQS